MICARISDGSDDSKTLSKAGELAQVLGFSSMFESVREQSMRAAENQFNAMFERLKAEHPSLPPETLAELRSAGQEFLTKAVKSWDANEVATLYAKALAEALPEKVLNDAIEHYRTPQGQKELKAISSAASTLNAYISSKIQKELQEGMPEFMKKVQTAVQKARAGAPTVPGQSEPGK